MRKAVITGLLACALAFYLNGQQVKAAPIDLLTKPVVGDTGIELALSTTTTGVLLPDTNKQADPTDQPAPIVHTVQAGESLSKIAAEYQTTWVLLYYKNTQIDNPDVINVGQEIMIPAPDEELAPREMPAVAVEESTANTAERSYYASGDSSGNLYVPGQCTWYAKSRRPDLPNNLGNASTWVSRAAAQGIPTGSKPQVGAIGASGNHVVYVESVNADGTVTVTDMNWSGPYQITRRTVVASSLYYIY
ncbi:LysM peptidoglycan-binding domain-containing protein [Candidatus Saccharibacteria bacterium]|nr:LysM peptidoglycan-binding domain-containing protein [Candidatus Saccharibacteria bacterium]MCB9821448.1 LysM peptidoglycan-binding domain-containing protein [Candidatus Nomurabacteria bacterium]